MYYIWPHQPYYPIPLPPLPPIPPLPLIPPLSLTLPPLPPILSPSLRSPPVPSPSQVALDLGDDLSTYTLVGMLCGLAIYNNVVVDLPFPLALYKMLLGR